MLPNHDPERKSPKTSPLSHAWWMGFIGGALYMALLLFLPFWLVIGIAFYVGHGKEALQNALKSRGSSMEAIATNFSQCLKLFAMQILWPLSVSVISTERKK